MAYTSIHPIKSTLYMAINYITNPNKTEEQKYAEGINCNANLADMEFLCTQKQFDYKGENLAYHLIQSFAPGEATPEQAHEIGVRLAEELLKGQYEYVISTHVDKNHIHNHIMINAVNFETGRTFSTEHDRKYKPAWQEIRNISDALCEEQKLSVIQSPEKGTRKSHYEWEQEQGGNSWKAKLKTAIDDCIKGSKTFDDFLEKMRGLNYEIKHGKHIAFRAEGQERFTRAKTLGYHYTEEQIKYRIERRVLRAEAWKAEMKRREANPFIADNNVGRFVEMTDEITQNEGLRRWAILQNMKSTSKLLNTLAENGVRNKEEIREKLTDLHDSRIDIVDEIKEIEKRMTQTALDLKNLNTYRQTKPVNDSYKAAKNKEKFAHEHESELILFNMAKEQVKGLVKENGKLPAVTVLEKEYEALKEQKAELMAQYKEIKSEISQIEKLDKDYEKMERAQDERKKSTDIE